MKKFFCKHLALAIMIATVQPVIAQSEFAGLESLKSKTHSAHYSKGFKDRAKDISKTCEKAMEYYNEVLGISPEIHLLVLSKADWSTYTKFPVYGMPHYNNEKTLIVAAEDNEFWQSFIPPAEALVGEMGAKVRGAYTNKEGKLSMQPFMDLLVLHELGHGYYQQGGLTKQRLWLSEFFSNLFLHTYIAEKEPKLLPALEVFPKMVIASGAANFQFTTLDQLEKNYELIATQHPQNYGWYQSNWHKGAADVYNAAGKTAVKKFWDGFKRQTTIVDEPELAEFLRTTVHPSMVDFYLQWGKR